MSFFHLINYVAQVLRKSTSERLPPKEDTKVKISTKSFKEENKAGLSANMATTNGNLADPNRLHKQIPSVGKKTPGNNANHGLPGNFSKVSLSKKTLTDGNASWTSLPSSLAKLGKVRSFKLINIDTCEWHIWGLLSRNETSFIINFCLIDSFLILFSQ